MREIDIDNIFENKLPWIVRYGLVVSVVFIAAVVVIIFKLGKNDFVIKILDNLKITNI